MLFSFLLLTIGYGKTNCADAYILPTVHTRLTAIDVDRRSCSNSILESTRYYQRSTSFSGIVTQQQQTRGRYERTRCFVTPPTGSNRDEWHENDEQNNTDPSTLSRRETLARAASAVILSSSLQIPPVFAEDSTTTAKPIPIFAQWTAVDGLNSNLPSASSQFVSFDPSAYKAMRDDPSRTPLFQRAITNRLSSAPGGASSQTVLDLGTGPFALFSIIAAEAGAGKVYAIEANPEVATIAREFIKQKKYSDVITVLDGFSTDVVLPNNEKVDLVIAEIVGSIASEEGAYATILDAHSRFVKEPQKPSSWIPNRIQTYAAPASYTLHNLFTPPEFDWDKLKGEPVRFNCRDRGLQLLSDPVLVEDINFAEITAANKQQQKQMDFTFTIDKDRIDDNTIEFYEEFRRGRIAKKEAEGLAIKTGHSVSGIAFWPRLILEDAPGTVVINSRTYPEGDHQRSHWQTVLPIMSSKPVAGLKGGEKVRVTAFFDLPEVVTKPPSYRLEGSVFVG